MTKIQRVIVIISNSNTFGVISSQANSPRRMQLGLKLYW